MHILFLTILGTKKIFLIKYSYYFIILITEQIIKRIFTFLQKKLKS